MTTCSSGDSCLWRKSTRRSTAPLLMRWSMGGRSGQAGESMRCKSAEEVNHAPHEEVDEGTRSKDFMELAGCLQLDFGIFGTCCFYDRR